jgi:hypothetical protein
MGYLVTIERARRFTPVERNQRSAATFARGRVR